jgi:hypothetical protein
MQLLLTLIRCQSSHVSVKIENLQHNLSQKTLSHTILKTHLLIGTHGASHSRSDLGSIIAEWSAGVKLQLSRILHG